ncbi:MAG: squalene synthase HpnC [Phycisphaerales bacterium]|nr:squalene synthase HpnC [Phycisphaerales bacterium]
MDATPTITETLRQYGPGRCDRLTPEQARRWCRALAHGHYENFSVLSPLVPRELTDDFAAVYAFCRWADDLGDEGGEPAERLELLSWWRDELHLCFAGEPRHPVFVALADTVQRHALPIEPFDNLIAAFEQDQSVARYETWEQVLDYCRRSADPVGRLVLMLLGEPRTDDMFGRSDRICTALQLTNHWQDIARDKLERDRIYVPQDMNGIEDFERRLETSARQGWACDRSFLAESRAVVRTLVERTWPLFDEGATLLPLLQPRSRPVVWLFYAGGTHILRSIEAWNYETVIHRPRLGAVTKLGLVARAWVQTRFARRATGSKRPQAPGSDPKPLSTSMAGGDAA